MKKGYKDENLLAFNLNDRWKIPLYRHFVEHAKGLGIQKVETGEFGAHMDVLCANDGPITLIIDTERIGK